METRYRLFLWNWCEMCGPAILCPECGNSTCNATFGKDQTCNVCNLAYQFGHLAYITGQEPKNKKEMNRLNKKIIKEEGHKDQDYTVKIKPRTKKEKKLLNKIFGKI